MINSVEELINQLKSLREDAKTNMHSPLRDAVFYRDFNALTIAITFIEEEMILK